LPPLELRLQERLVLFGQARRGTGVVGIQVVAEATAARVVKTGAGHAGEILGVRAAAKAQARRRTGVAVGVGDGVRKTFCERRRNLGGADRVPQRFQTGALVGGVGVHGVVAEQRFDVGVEPRFGHEIRVRAERQREPTHPVVRRKHAVKLAEIGGFRAVRDRVGRAELLE
jgi:hypothetical protein